MTDLLPDFDQAAFDALVAGLPAWRPSDLRILDFPVVDLSLVMVDVDLNLEMPVLDLAMPELDLTMPDLPEFDLSELEELVL